MRLFLTELEAWPETMQSELQAAMLCIVPTYQSSELGQLIPFQLHSEDQSFAYSVCLCSLKGEHEAHSQSVKQS